MKKKYISLLLALILLFGISANVFAFVFGVGDQTLQIGVSYQINDFLYSDMSRPNYSVNLPGGMLFEERNNGRNIDVKGTPAPGTVGTYDIHAVEGNIKVVRITVNKGPQTIVADDKYGNTNVNELTIPFGSNYNFRDDVYSLDGNQNKINISAIDPGLVDGHQPGYVISVADPSVATITASGTIIPVADGTTTITITSGETGSYTAATRTIPLSVLSSVGTPTTNIAGGIYDSAQTVTLSSTTVGAKIYYTLDGTDPKSSGSRQTYTGPFSVEMGKTLKAYATRTGITDSTVMTEVYTQMETVATPIANPASGTYASAQMVTLSSTTAGATIYYTLDGTDPRTSGSREIYSLPFSVEMGQTLKAYATAINMIDSTEKSEVYTQMGTVAKPTANPVGGAYTSAQTVTLSSATEGATIYYTLDGSDPVNSETRQKYIGPFSVAMGQTLKAYATATDMLDSTELREVYTQSQSGGSSSGGKNILSLPKTGEYAIIGGALLLGLLGSLLVITGRKRRKGEK